jgi:hypothetical protein
MSDPLILDTENRQDPTALQNKVLYAGDSWGGQPYISVQEDSIVITASKTNGIALSDKFGITLGGPISFSVMPDQISIGGGYWRFNPLLLSCIPSTTPTPVPTLIKSTPRLLSAKDDIDGSVSDMISNSDAAI